MDAKPEAQLCDDPNCPIVPGFPHSLSAHGGGHCLIGADTPKDLKYNVGSLGVGEKGEFDSGKQFEVVSQGTSGTVIQFLARVMKSVTTEDPLTGQKKTVKFSSKGATQVISSGSIVRRVHE